MSARLTAWGAVLVIVAADGAVIIAAGPPTAMVAWAVGSAIAGVLTGVASMVPVVREAERDASWLTFGAGAESPAARSRVPGQPGAAADAPTGAVAVSAGLFGAVEATRGSFEAGLAATRATQGRREAAARLQRDRADARERERLVSQPCDPTACCEAGRACDVHAPLHQGRTSRWGHQRPTFDDLGMIEP